MSLDRLVNSTEKLASIRSELREQFIERDELVDGALIALLSSQHMLLIGPPGTAKSMLAKALCERVSGNYFEWLLTKFTTPEEIFGPISLPALEQGRYERITRHKLPEAQVAFLDEVFKANSAILNALLTVLNERRFYQGVDAIDVPLGTLVAASNELPDEEELAALYDRFLLRFVVGYIESDQGFRRLLRLGDAEPPANTVLSSGELHELQGLVERVKVPAGVLAEIGEVRRQLNQQGLLASDRRYRQLLVVLRAAAVLEGRDSVLHRDLKWLEHVLWQQPEDRHTVLKVLSSLSGGFADETRRLRKQAREIDAYARRQWPDESARQRALLEAHTKLEEIHRRFETLGDELRERGRDATELDVEEQHIAALQRALLGSEDSWQS